MTRSLNAITAASRDIAEGRFDVEVDVNSRRGDELEVLAHAIRQMATRLKTLVDGQKRFLADAAHELRSPLARMTIATALIERTADDKTRHHVADLKEDVELMTHLTDDLLVFARSKLAAAHVSLESTNVREVAASAVRLEAKEADVRLNVDPELRVLATPDLLGRALSNLVRNAVQHANPSGPICIRAMLDGHYATISVADEGPGVPVPDLPAMFVPFRRLEISRDRRSGGVGLGLAIVQSAIELCGGTVSCRNLAPRGFEVRLSLRRD
jgi:two-component system sensor histidine kinase CpxA